MSILNILKCNLFIWCNAEFLAAITPVSSVSVYELTGQ